MRNKKESPIVRVEEKVMEGVLRKIKGSKMSRTAFVSDAVEKEIKRLDSENDAVFLKIIKDHYDEKQSHYTEKGIFDFEDFIKKVVLNEGVADIIKRLGKESKNIKELEKNQKKFEQKIKQKLIKLTEESEERATEYQKELEILRKQ